MWEKNDAVNFKKTWIQHRGCLQGVTCPCESSKGIDAVMQTLCAVDNLWVNCFVVKGNKTNSEEPAFDLREEYGIFRQESNILD